MKDLLQSYMITALFVFGLLSGMIITKNDLCSEEDKTEFSFAIVGAVLWGPAVLYMIFNPENEFSGKRLTCKN